MAWSWRGGLNWRVNDDTLLHASVLRGQKSGGFFSGITLATVQLLPYRSEELTAYEPEATFGPLEGIVRIDGAYGKAPNMKVVEWGRGSRHL